MATMFENRGTDYRYLVQDDRIHGSVFTDPAIFSDEMDRIFNRGWVFVAHESEIPEPGSYVTRRIGTQSVIVTRDRSGGFQVFYNRCTHRGARLCQQASGMAKWITCPYHGWVFDGEGRLIDLPADAAYPRDFDRKAAALRGADQVDSYGGFIFANLVANGISLKQHLGRATELIDALLGLSPTGRIRLSAGWMKHKTQCNWKMFVENQVDGYHVQMVHGSLLSANTHFAGVRNRKEELPTRVRDMGLGHTDIDFASDHRATADRILRWTGGVEPEKIPGYIAAMKAAYGEEGAHQKLVDGPPHSMLFPNISLAEMNIMTIEPISVDTTVVYTTPVFLEGGDDLNIRTLRRCEGAMGPAGFLIADDAEIGELAQMGLQDQQPEWNILSRGLETEHVNADGIRIGGLMDETTQRGFWRHYRDVMAG